MSIGDGHMKYLIIENGQGFYCLDGNYSSKRPLDKINKEDLLELVKLCAENETFEMDTYDVNVIHHAAHRINYKNIFQKLDDLQQHRITLSDEKTSLYRVAIDKYSKNDA